MRSASPARATGSANISFRKARRTGLLFRKAPRTGLLFRQAAEFGRQYGKELSPKQVKLLQAFVSLRKMNRAQKIFTILKYGFTFNRLHRTVGECMFL